MRVRRKDGTFTSASNFHHGHSVRGKETSEYRAYQDAKIRCTNSGHKSFKDYGGRGIKFLFKSFEQFFKHLGWKPSPNLVLDRIENDGNYEIGNVRWTTRSESQRNQRMTQERLDALRSNAKIAHMFTVKDPKTGRFI